ncbi:MAG: urease accessory protein [Pseudomonadales bacterium]|nr:urease accessory protein [Pseudomonadales bacterium]
MLVDFLPVIFVGFGLGLMHALDADHIMAVSTLSNTKPGLKRTLFYSANWAAGHGLVLLVSGFLLFAFGLMIPESLQQFAEAGVGVLLIGLGLSCFWQFRKEKLKLQPHSHGEMVHTHWHEDGHEGRHEESGAHSSTQDIPQNQPLKKDDLHKPVFVGLLHGLAGSAPALALIPAVGQGQVSLALAYLALFSIGVMLSMVIFGLGFANVQGFLQRRNPWVFEASRRLLATSSIVFGGYWLSQAI